MATDDSSSSSLPTSTPVALADFPLELRIQILSKRAFMHLDDTLMRMFDWKRDRVEKFYDYIRRKECILGGPLLHSAWHGGLYDCNGWGHLRRGHSNIIIVEACETLSDKNDLPSELGFLCSGCKFFPGFVSMTYNSVATFSRTTNIVRFETTFLDQFTGTKFNNIQCKKTRRVCQLLYVFNKTCQLWPLPLLSYSCLNARDEIKFGISGTETDTRTAFQTLMNKRFWTRAPIHSGLKLCPFTMRSCLCDGVRHIGGGCIFMENGYTKVSTCPDGSTSDISFEIRTSPSAPVSMIKDFGRYQLNIILKALPKRIVSDLASAAGVSPSHISPLLLSDEDIYCVIWTKLRTLKRKTLYNPSLEELGPIFSHFAHRYPDNVIGIFLPSPWKTVYLDLNDEDYLLLNDYIDTPYGVETLLQFHRNSLNQMRIEYVWNPGVIEWDLLDESQPPLHCLMTVLRKDDQAMVCHCGTHCSL